MTSFFIQKPCRLALFLAVLTAVFLPLPNSARAEEKSTSDQATQRAEEINEISESLKIQRKKKAEETTDAPIVVELFSALDCSACIYGDRILFDAVKDKQVIGLTCLVKDIDNADTVTVNAELNNNKPIEPCMLKLWSYETGKPNQENTNVSIPLFIVNGRRIVNTPQFQSFGSVLEQYKFAASNGTLEPLMRWTGKGTITISLPQDTVQPVLASVWLIRYKNTHVEKMNSGVNKDRVLRFSNVVQYSQHIGKWYGQPRDIIVNVPPPQGGTEVGGYAVLVKKTIDGEILAAGNLPDYPL